jgi:transposase
MLKNYIDFMSSHVRTDNTLGGYLFIAFLALILRMKPMNLMIKSRSEQEVLGRRIAFRA